MIKNVITGASGFIGSNLSKKLGVEGTPHADIMLVPECENFFFLSTYGNMASHTDNYMMLRANVLDLINAISREHEFFVFMSSSSVLLPVQTPYAHSKKAAEEILLALPQLKSCIVRPYSVTGIGEQPEHLIPSLIRSCIEGEIMPFDPDPVHDFIDVEDVVDGLVWTADRKAIGIVEFGSGIPHTNQEVRGIVEEVCGKKANVQPHEGLREYDNVEWYCRKPAFKPKKTLQQSIEEMVEAYSA